MVYTVLKIEEDMDFGCEERNENIPVMAVLTIADEEGNQRAVRYPDRELYRLEVNEGDRITLDSVSGELKKYPGLGY